MAANDQATKEVLESTAPVGLFHVVTHRGDPIVESGMVFDLTLGASRFSKAELMARVCQTPREAPRGVYDHIIRPDGLSVVYTFAEAVD
jgi:hypothetical protein